MFDIHAVFRVFNLLFFAVRFIVVPFSFLFMYLTQVSSLVSQPGDSLLSERNRQQGPDKPATSTTTTGTTTAAARTDLVLGEGEGTPPPSLLALARELGPAGLMRGTQVRRARSKSSLKELPQGNTLYTNVHYSSFLSLNPFRLVYTNIST